MLLTRYPSSDYSDYMPRVIFRITEDLDGFWSRPFSVWLVTWSLDFGTIPLENLRKATQEPQIFRRTLVSAGHLGPRSYSTNIPSHGLLMYSHWKDVDMYTVYCILIWYYTKPGQKFFLLTSYSKPLPLDSWQVAYGWHSGSRISWFALK